MSDAPRAAVAFVGLGGNVGDAPRTLREALGELDAIPGTRLARASRLYRSAAWGRTDQPDFTNAVAMLETTLPPRDLLDALLGIERGHGRDRARETRWGPRVLDLDLLAHGETQLDEPGLTLPHPRLAQRAFVMVPLAEIAPDFIVPGLGGVRALAQASPAADIEPLG